MNRRGSRVVGGANHASAKLAIPKRLRGVETSRFAICLTCERSKTLCKCASPPSAPRSPRAWRTVEIPKPPSVNEMYANAKGKGRKGRFKTKKYCAWIVEASPILRAVNDRISGLYEVRMEIGRRKNSDVDNRIKAAGDLLVSLGIVADDSRCERIVLEWGDDLASNRARLHWRPWSKALAHVR